MRASRKGLPVRHPERVEQNAILRLISSLGGCAWVLGTTRRRGDYQGTMQTPGVADVYGVLPARPPFTSEATELAFWVEVKAKGGRLRPEQKVFREHCLAAGVEHIVGGVDAFIAWCITRGYLRADQVAHYRVHSGRTDTWDDGTTSR